MRHFIGLALLAVLPSWVQGFDEADAKRVAIEGYIYGYPLVTMEATRQVMTNVESPVGFKAPMGQFAHARVYPSPDFKDVTAPNADTLYSAAWINLTQEPYILHVPDEKGRYYLMPMLSGWTDVFEVPGTRTTSTGAADFAITGPGWKGTLPEGVKELKAPTNMVWILGRTYCSGTPEDYKAVHEIQDQYTLTPLSYYGKPYTPPKGVVNPAIDTKTPVRDQVNSLTGVEFFMFLSELLRNNPPAPADDPMIMKLEQIGVVPGKDFNPDKLDPKIQRAIAEAPKEALKIIMNHYKDAGTVENNWLVSTKTGLYGTDYLQRALIAAVGLGANRPQDAIYPATYLDSSGATLNGKNKYVLHFAKGELPPVKGFWSLTMYDEQYFFVKNPLNRYTLSPRNDLKVNPDGSVDLYLQNQSPGPDKESNWLPAPEGPFRLMLRLYWPDPQVIQGIWQPPGVQRV